MDLNGRWMYGYWCGSRHPFLWPWSAHFLPGWCPPSPPRSVLLCCSFAFLSLPGLLRNYFSAGIDCEHLHCHLVVNGSKKHVLAEAIPLTPLKSSSGTHVCMGCEHLTRGLVESCPQGCLHGLDYSECWGFFPPDSGVAEMQFAFPLLSGRDSWSAAGDVLFVAGWLSGDWGPWVRDSTFELDLPLAWLSLSMCFMALSVIKTLARDRKVMACFCSAYEYQAWNLLLCFPSACFLFSFPFLKPSFLFGPCPSEVISCSSLCRVVRWMLTLCLPCHGGWRQSS